MRNLNDTKKLPILIPCAASKGRVIFPKMMVPVEFSRKKYEVMAEYLRQDKENAYVVILEKLKGKNVGTLCKYIETYQAAENRTILLLSGYERVLLKEEPQKTEDGLYVAEIITAVETRGKDEVSRLLLTNQVLPVFDKVMELARIPKETLITIRSHKNNIGAVCDIMTSVLDISTSKKYKILESLHIPNRVQLLLKYLEEFLEILKTTQSIARETRKKLDNKNKEYYLRSEMETIKKKLGDEDPQKGEVSKYKKEIKKKKLPKEAKKEAEVELRRMERMHPASHEYSVIATYLDWILDLPWNDSTKDMLDIKEARKKLNNDHFGLDKPKKRILEYLAIRKLNPESRSPILCFSGPPGVGKTSIGRSIAEAMGREFQRMSLGGVRDEAVIRGFKRTYVGSMPGRIIQSIKRAGTNNPIIMLDEVDKLGADHKGDPSSALLEALDPEQNHSFNDHYLNVSFDLSKVIFITTANLLEMIPPALRDRMEVIKFPGYSQNEKEQIAQDFLIPRQLKEHGVKELKFTKYALDEIINGYTREAGVRNLEREIANIIRGVGCRYVEDGDLAEKIGRKDVAKYLEATKFPNKDDIEITKPGIGIGMYYSAVGGGIMFCEAVKMKIYGKSPKYTVSGNLKNVMKESITVAVNWLRANQYDVLIKETDFKGIDNSDIHIHIPEGASPKDGPSAGVAIIVSLVSLFSNRIPKDKTSYTGEITLRGKVLPVGGIKEKVIGAHRSGIKNIVMPSWSKTKLDRIPKDIKNNMKFYFVDTIDEVLDIAFKEDKL